ncbi:MAG TPA: hypothetical protein VFH47_07250 [Candidatus Thermoplasmatota archaeon]|nr:hypothetical protein [Candidatus Thermoplasmatota archaeon]
MANQHRAAGPPQLAASWQGAVVAALATGLVSALVAPAFLDSAVLRVAFGATVTLIAGLVWHAGAGIWGLRR